MAAARFLAEMVARQRGYLFPWCPVFLGIGICLFFALRFEPSFAMVALVALGCLVLAYLAKGNAHWAAPLAVALACCAAGFVVAAVRAHFVAAPVLEWRYNGPVAGRIVAIDRSASDALRLTLDQVVLSEVSRARTPLHVRVSLHGDRSADTTLHPGAHVMTTAHLSPPNGPVEPGGFDFRRHSWFRQIGAVGYSRVPLLARAPPDQGLDLAVFRLRMALSAQLRNVLPGDVGGFAAAVTTGDRSGLSQEAIEDLRVTNTAHLLAISGLHMGLLSGFVFLTLRIGLALVPLRRLRWPAKKYAAFGALVVASLYLALSGGNVATQRAFVMVSVAFVAVLLDRRAISMRAVAVAALIVLILRPESVLGPGFQMSFAATTALVAVFGGLRDVGWRVSTPVVRGAVAVVLSSIIAGLATAPVGAAHFNQIARYGLLANVLCVPVMGSVVVPFAVLAALLAPFGGEWLPLQIMALGLEWILTVSGWIADWPETRRPVPTPPQIVLPLLALGGLWVALWQGRGRMWGALPMVAAFAIWAGGQRPVILIAPEATLMGVLTPEGRALSKARGAGFVADVWLENDGQSGGQKQAAARWGDAGFTSHKGRQLWHISGQRDAAGFEGCSPRDIVVTRVPLGDVPCTVHKADDLKNSGALAYLTAPQGLTIWSDADQSGARLWTPYEPRVTGWWVYALPR